MAWLSRWLPALTMMLVSIISYVDRNTLALLAPSILEQTHLSAAQYGWAVAAYSIAFALSNPLWGRLLDRVGVRIGMTAAVLFWSLASASHGLAKSFLGFALARAMLGLGEGAAAPGGLRTVTQTLPVANRARGIALTYSGGSAGAILTPLLMAPVAAHFGFRGAFAFTGGIGLLWVIGWLLLSQRNDLRPSVTTAPASSLGATERPSLRDPRVSGFLLGYGLGALPLGFVVYCSPLYLHRVLGLSQLTLGKLLWLPPLGSELGIFFWGFLADRLGRRRPDRLHRTRRLLPLALVLGAPLAFLPLLHSVPLVLAVFFLAMFAAAAFQVLVVGYGSEVFSREHVGYVAGLGSGAYGAALFVLMPQFGRLFDAHAYGTAFVLAALCPALGYLCLQRLATIPKEPLALEPEFE